MELREVSKTRKKGRGNVPDYQKAHAANRHMSLDEMADMLEAGTKKQRAERAAAAAAPHAPSPVPPGTPYNKIKPWHVKAPKYAAGALAATAAAGGGAYLYRRKRLERSLS